MSRKTIERITELQRRFAELRDKTFEIADDANLLVSELRKLNAGLINEEQCKESAERRTQYANALSFAGRSYPGKLDA